MWGRLVGSAFDVLVRNAFGVVGSVATWLQPSEAERRAVAQADALADAEAEFEVHEHPSDFVGCDCPSRLAADLDDHHPACTAHNPFIVEVSAFHRPNIEARDGLWCWCGQFCLNLSNHEAHVQRVIADMLAADARVQPTVRKHQQ